MIRTTFGKLAEEATFVYGDDMFIKRMGTFHPKPLIGIDYNAVEVKKKERYEFASGDDVMLIEGEVIDG